MAPDGRMRRDVLLTPGQALKERLMREILKRVQDVDLILKGGSALAFGYSIGRHSTDLDFDGRIRLDLRGRMRKAARAAGVDGQLLKPDNRKKYQRFRISYPVSYKADSEVLKVEVHFPPWPKSKDIVVVTGIRMYGWNRSSTRRWRLCRAGSRPMTSST